MTTRSGLSQLKAPGRTRCRPRCLRQRGGRRGSPSGPGNCRRRRAGRRPRGRPTRGRGRRRRRARKRAEERAVVAVDGRALAGGGAVDLRRELGPAGGQTGDRVVEAPQQTAPLLTRKGLPSRSAVTRGSCSRPTFMPGRPRPRPRREGCACQRSRRGERRRHVDAVPILTGDGGPLVDLGHDRDLAPGAGGAADDVEVAGPGGGGDVVADSGCCCCREDRVADRAAPQARARNADGRDSVTVTWAIRVLTVRFDDMPVVHLEKSVLSTRRPVESRPPCPGPC